MERCRNSSFRNRQRSEIHLHRQMPEIFKRFTGDPDLIISDCWVNSGMTSQDGCLLHKQEETIKQGTSIAIFEVNWCFPHSSVYSLDCSRCHSVDLDCIPLWNINTCRCTAAVPFSSLACSALMHAKLGTNNWAHSGVSFWPGFSMTWVEKVYELFIEPSQCVGKRVT